MTFSSLLVDYQQTHEHHDAQKWWIVMAGASDGAG